MQKIEKGNNSVLLQEALSLFDQGVSVLISDPETKSGIDRHSAYAPILEREHVVQMCEENPMANLEVVIGTEKGLVALEVGVGNWEENGKVS